MLQLGCFPKSNWTPAEATHIVYNGENLYLYLMVPAHALSAALVREICHIQQLVYFVSKLFTGQETKYPKLEKLA